MMMHAPRLVIALCVAAACVASAGCGYALAGRGTFLPSHIRVIGVPVFANHTSVYDVERKISNAVRSELSGRGKYVVEPEAKGDAILTGEIQSISITPAATNAQRQAVQYSILLVAKVELTDTKENKVIWSNPALQFREEFAVNATSLDPTAFFGQDVNALDRLSTEFARSLVSAILEAF